MSLHDYLEASARRCAGRDAVEEAQGERRISYAALDAVSDRLRDRLVASGVQRGDRVGICLNKSIDAGASIFGILKAGAAYMPVDPVAPAGRNAYILSDCAVRVAIVARELLPGLMSRPANSTFAPQTILVDTTLERALESADANAAAPASASVAVAPDDLAYILYTSGSTGKPKGVMLSHRNALSFVDWCLRCSRPAARTGFPRTRRFTSTCRSSTSTCRSSTARRWC